MSEPKHSPLPWVCTEQSDFTPETPFWIQAEHPVCGLITHAFIGPGCDESSDIGDPEANAAFIIRACNSYYAMRETLQAASAALGPMENLINPDLRALKKRIEENL